MSGEWECHGEEVVYRGRYIAVAVADVTSPTGVPHRYDVVRHRFEGAGCLVVDGAGAVLLTWRHRFITNAWGWEVPAGHIADQEEPAVGAAREAAEETGWEVVQPRVVWSLDRSPGRTDSRVHLVVGRVGRQVRAPDPDEATRGGWFSPQEVVHLLTAGEVHDLFSAAALWWWLASNGGSCL